MSRQPAVHDGSYGTTPDAGAGTATEASNNILPRPPPPMPVIATQRSRESRPEAAEREYTVVSGDTLWGIAKRMGHRSWKPIADANPHVDPNRLRLGETLRIPAVAARVAEQAVRPEQPPRRLAAVPERERTPARRGVYVVKSGDNLSKIARATLGDRDLYLRIFEANKDVLSDPNRVRVGMELRIPDEAPRSTRRIASAGARSSDEPVRERRPTPRFGEVPAAATDVYRVQRGDSLHAIAARFYGDGDRWPVIHKANEERIPNPNRLRIGLEIRIP